jgi:hypothetical protein
LAASIVNSLQTLGRRTVGLRGAGEPRTLEEAGP